MADMETRGMIERVAVAIAERRRAADQKNACNSGCDVYLMITAYMPEALLDARAAIEAMREPTEEMCEAGNNYDGVGHSWGLPTKGGSGEYITNSGDVFTAMIDAALSIPPDDTGGG